MTKLGLIFLLIASTVVVVVMPYAVAIFLLIGE
jgi:hypothetical protein